MKGKTFDRKIEEAAGRFECWAEASADQLDKGLTRAWNESRLFRFTARGISMTAELGLIAGANYLAGRRHKTAAMWCAGLGAAGLAADLVTALIFWRERRK